MKASNNIIETFSDCQQIPENVNLFFCSSSALWPPILTWEYLKMTLGTAPQKWHTAYNFLIS